ncbi:hypothetical protein [Pseudomonas sp. CMR5c]|nr:hypothetical protein [Pseudomonas sp. CMR5c]
MSLQAPAQRWRKTSAARADELENTSALAKLYTGFLQSFVSPAPPFDGTSWPWIGIEFSCRPDGHNDQGHHAPCPATTCKMQDARWRFMQFARILFSGDFISN